MKTFQIRTVSFGQGPSKICIPLTGACYEELMDETSPPMLLYGDMVEWRADYYAPDGEIASVTGMLKDVRKNIGELPLLFTFRSREEGGFGRVSDDAYFDLNESILRSGKADILDLELSRDQAGLKDLIKKSESAGVKIILSYHNFLETPSTKEMLKKLQRMQDLGAHMTKIAVMPKDMKDVLTLLFLSQSMREEYADVPFIAVSMGEKGVMSRVFSGSFGSAITYGAGSHASAPGQIKAEDLRNIMDILSGGKISMPSRVFLIGFMGCGKTSIGKLLSERLDYSFEDMDELIETDQGISIADIFKSKGERYFREIESHLLVRLSTKNKAVISCGGGIVESAENIKILAAAGYTVFLKDDICSMYNRVKDDKNRPLVRGRSNKMRGCNGFKQLYLSRLPRYEEAAAISIFGTGKDKEQVVDEITGLLKRRY